ncbi:MAG: hypothetical protein ACI4O7_15455 [Aristaeellaceae bacterium]
MMEILAAMGLAAAVFAAGLLVMHRVDLLLRGMRQERSGRAGAEGDCLRIGVCDPLTAGSLWEALAEGGEEPEVQLLCGTEHELLRAMEEHRLDMALVPEKAFAPGGACRACTVQLKRRGVRPGIGRASVEPVTPGPVRQTLVWRASGTMAAELLQRALAGETGGGRGGNVV